MQDAHVRKPALNFRSLDLNLLRVFDAVMAEGSVTRAAEVLAMTQPAVSHALKRLHGAVGEPLFVRTAVGMRPTARADALWPEVRGALGGLRNALAPGGFEPARDAAFFHLAMADATAAMLTPGIVAALEREQALANLRVRPLTTRDPRTLLEAGDVSLAIGFFPAAVTAIVTGTEPTLRQARLYVTRYVCVMRRDHPLAQAPLTLEAYCDAHHLLVSFSGRAHGYIDTALAARGRQRRVVLTVNQFFTAGRVVAESDLLTVLPESFLAATGYRDRLVSRELPIDPGPVHVDMVWHLRHDADPAQQWLRAVVQQVADSTP
jgi:DNA-binding transcriptional LysR family regulator